MTGGPKLNTNGLVVQASGIGKSTIGNRSQDSLSYYKDWGGGEIHGSHSLFRNRNATCHCIIGAICKTGKDAFPGNVYDADINIIYLAISATRSISIQRYPPILINKLKWGGPCTVCCKDI